MGNYWLIFVLPVACAAIVALAAVATDKLSLDRLGLHPGVAPPDAVDMKLDLTVADLTGKLAIVTGASDGIGRVLATRLAAAGAELVLPVRNMAKAERTLGHVNARTHLVDLADVRQVQRFAETVQRPVHLLVNNAGVMAPATRHAAPAGLELQFVTNHLSHFALIMGLLPQLRAGQARVTTVTSFAVRSASVAWDDLQSERSYRPMRAYGVSKLAQALCAVELDRRSRQGGWGITSNLAHPGLTSTNLQASGPNLGRTKDSPVDRWFKRLSKRGVLVQTVEEGMRPALYAASSPHAKGSELYGPGGFAHLTGAPVQQRMYRRLQDQQSAERMWDVSEALIR